MHHESTAIVGVMPAGMVRSLGELHFSKQFHHYTTHYSFIVQAAE
jgi:hypothetical protein